MNFIDIDVIFFYVKNICTIWNIYWPMKRNSFKPTESCLEASGRCLHLLFLSFQNVYVLLAPCCLKISICKWYVAYFKTIKSKKSLLHNFHWKLIIPFWLLKTFQECATNSNRLQSPKLNAQKIFACQQLSFKADNPLSKWILENSKRL